jgi:hypothetical protein
MNIESFIPPQSVQFNLLLVLSKTVHGKHIQCAYTGDENNDIENWSNKKWVNFMNNRDLDVVERAIFYKDRNK